ncbi:MAG: hypothetical protein ACKOF7_13725, partial [Phycisphaerales bacterium]
MAARSANGARATSMPRSASDAARAAASERSGSGASVSESWCARNADARNPACGTHGAIAGWN